MQTFVPYGSDFAANAKVLDRQRLGKQRVEAWQILNALRGLSKGWVSHPATKMWEGHEAALCRYGIVVCDEWIRRGYADSMRQRFVDTYATYEVDITPTWLDRPEVALSHRSNLVRKMPEYYGQLWTDVSDDLPYVWPAGVAA